MTNTHVVLGELDEALVTGTRALILAEQRGDLRLRMLAVGQLVFAHSFRGEYERAVQLGSEALASLPAEWVYETFGHSAPASIWNRCLLVRSLSELGRFAEAATHDAEARRLAEPMQHAYTVGFAHQAAGFLHLLKGDWPKAYSPIEHARVVLQAGNVVLQLANVIALSAWVLA